MSDKKLTKMRDELDKIDVELIELLARRFQITEKIGWHKAQNKLPAFDASREKEIYLKLRKLAGDKGLNPDMVEKIQGLIISEVKKRHKIIANSKD